MKLKTRNHGKTQNIIRLGLELGHCNFGRVRVGIVDMLRLWLGILVGLEFGLGMRFGDRANKRTSSVR